MELRPSEIYFTHSKIRGQFTGCGKRLEETLQELIDGTTKISDIPKIKVIVDPETGKYFSMNNRRLWVFKQLEDRGLLATVPVTMERMKPKSKMRNNTYSLTAKIALKWLCYSRYPVLILLSQTDSSKLETTSELEVFTGHTSLPLSKWLHWQRCCQRSIQETWTWISYRNTLCAVRSFPAHVFFAMIMSCCAAYLASACII